MSKRPACDHHSFTVCWCRQKARICITILFVELVVGNDARRPFGLFYFRFVNLCIFPQNAIWSYDGLCIDSRERQRKRERCKKNPIFFIAFKWIQVKLLFYSVVCGVRSQSPSAAALSISCRSTIRWRSINMIKSTFCCRASDNFHFASFCVLCVVWHQHLYWGWHCLVWARVRQSARVSSTSSWHSHTPLRQANNNNKRKE